MDFRSMLDQVKQAFVIGKNNPFLHGRQGRPADEPAYEDSGWQQPQPGAYAPQQGQYQPQQGQYQPQQGQYQPEPWQQPAQPAYQQPQQAYQPQQAQPMYQPPQQPVYEAPPQEPQYQFQSQFNPEPARNRRSQQHQQPQAPQQPAYQAPAAAAPENLVPFPGAQLNDTKQMDAYVINVFNINSCRQAMSCLRKGQCTLIVMDQLIDKAEIRRYVDMLTGACYALGGTMTRLSAKIGFYIMAPSGMTVYTDPTTTGANQQPRPQAQPLYRADATPGAAPTARGFDFAAQGAYAAVPQMQFAAHQAQPQAQAAPQQEGHQPEQQPGFNPWQEQHQPYAANN